MDGDETGLPEPHTREASGAAMVVILDMQASLVLLDCYRFERCAYILRRLIICTMACSSNTTDGWGSDEDCSRKSACVSV